MEARFGMAKTVGRWFRDRKRSARLCEHLVVLGQTLGWIINKKSRDVEEIVHAFVAMKNQHGIELCDGFLWARDKWEPFHHQPSIDAYIALNAEAERRGALEVLKERNDDDASPPDFFGK